MKRIVSILSLILTIAVLAGCSAEKMNTETLSTVSSQVPAIKNEDQAQATLKIDRLFHDVLIVRDQSFSEVKFLSDIETGEMPSLGFYPSASQSTNVHHSVIHKNHLFYLSTDDQEHRPCVKRVSPNGEVKYIDFRLGFQDNQSASIIGVNGDDIYIFMMDHLEDGENWIVRIRDCADSEYSVEKVMSLSATEFQNMDRDSIILVDDSIYFTASYNGEDNYLYRVTINQFEANPIYVFPDNVVFRDQVIMPSDNSGFMLCLPVKNDRYDTYYYNLETGNLTLIAEEIALCESGSSGSAYESRDGWSGLGCIEDGFYYHLHTDGHASTALLCRSTLNADCICEIVARDLPYDFYFEPNVLTVLKNHIFYYSGEVQESDSEYCVLYYYNVNDRDHDRTFKVNRKSGKSSDIKIIDGIIVAAIDCCVMYADASNPTEWFESEVDIDLDSNNVLVGDGQNIYCVSIENNYYRTNLSEPSHFFTVHLVPIGFNHIVE